MADQAPLRPLDMALIDELFDMKGGYVLGFSDRTFAQFFDAEVNVNIDDPRYSVDGTSKAKRLRHFLKSSPTELRVTLLRALWEYRQAHRRRVGGTDPIPDAQREFEALIARIQGAPGASPPPRERTAPQAYAGSAPALRAKLIALGGLAPQPRGYAFEAFLKALFDASGLAARASFRLVGEQIDGSFQLEGQTYLLEAKWEAPPTGANGLRAFNGKVEDKVAWARGLFISHTGFSEDGLEAFGKGHSVICMDGRDLNEMLERSLPLQEVIARKVRHAVETGRAFAPVSRLFP